MFWNKALLDSNIVKVFLTIDGINYYVVDDGFLKSPTKHDRNIEIDPKQ
jgi:hypothetical protein